MNTKYDMIVIGAGSGGLSMALGLHELGIRVLLIDRDEASIGGECLNNGCIPSKALIHVSKIVGNATKAKEFGLSIQGKVSLSKVWEYVVSTQNSIRAHENASYFKKKGLAVVIGEARFQGKRQVKVGDTVYTGKRITIATGSSPKKLNVSGMELASIYDNESIWSLPELPNKVLFIGAGPINMELAHAFTRLGSKVQIVEQAKTVLIKEDPEIREIIYQRSKALGIDFYFNTELLRLIDSNTALLRTDENEFQLTFDIVVVGIGREINFFGLNPEAAGIKLKEDGRLWTDEYQRTSNKNILVIGDAAGGPQFSHGAEHQATILIKNLFSPIKQKVTYENFSWVTFTEPEVATFGLNQDQLKRKGQKYHKLVLPLDEDDRAVTDHYQYGKLILFIGKSKLPWSNPKLLGGSLVAPNAGEIIQELILAKTAGLGIKSLFNKIYPYPTASRINKTIVLNKYTEGIAPWMKRILKLFY